MPDIAWTSEQILALAPDASSAKSGKDLANVRKWVSLHLNQSAGAAGAAWGECQGSGKDPYRTQIDLAEPAFKCSCPSRKFPCKHSLGLFLILAQNANAFSVAEPPAWVEEWLQSRAQRAQKQEAKQAESETKAADPKAQEKRASAREKKVAAGIAELELWLRDLVRRGLAAAPSDANPDKMAARLVDAQAGGLARMVREISIISLSGHGWQERLLERLARLHLLLEAWKRLDSLAPEMQAEVRAQIGWTQSQDELLAQNGVRDAWLVLGRRIEEDERLRTARTWLWGRQSNRATLVLDFAPIGRPLDLSFAPGLTFDAELVFYPGAAPLRALAKSRVAAPALDTMPGYATLHSALEACAQMRSRNPWQERFALPLQSVTIVREEAAWLARDIQNQVVPLAPRFTNDDAVWKLLALTGGQATSLFGEWNGEVFYPLSVWSEGKIVTL